MIEIAIVDDDKYTVQSCRELIKSLKIPNIDIIDGFESGEAFLNEILEKKVQYDIVILDIDMPNMSGFDVAKRLNELEIDIIIMFYTVHEQYVFKAYEYQPFRYIRKEFAKEELPFAMQCAISKIEKQNNRSIIIRTNKADKKIEIRQIVYVENYKNYIEIFISNGESYITKISLSEFFRLVSDSSFIYANKGNIVNLRYVKEITSKNIILKDNFEIPVSRRNYKSVKSAFAKFIGDII